MNDGGALTRRLFRQLELVRKIMFNQLHKLATVAAFASALIFAPLMSAFAYTVDPQVYAGTKLIPSRNCEFGFLVCYVRVTINFNDANIKNGVWFATLPKNAYILSVDSDVTTAFNAATTNVLTFGVTKASANELVADGASATANISNNTTTIATGILHLTTAAGLGTLITGNTTYQTGVDGGVPLYAKYTQTGTAATTGSMILILTFVKNNDN